MLRYVLQEPWAAHLCTGHQAKQSKLNFVQNFCVEHVFKARDLLTCLASGPCSFNNLDRKNNSKGMQCCGADACKMRYLRSAALSLVL